MICGVMATSISGCGACTACRVVRALHGTQYTHHILKYLLPQHSKSFNDVFLRINFRPESYQRYAHSFFLS